MQKGAISKKITKYLILVVFKHSNVNKLKINLGGEFFLD